jgi:hypothetical protein
VDLGGAGYTLWQHETGKNQVVGAVEEPIPSHFETNEISMLSAQEPQDSTLRVGAVEPDFVQTGDLTMTVKGRVNARSVVVESDPVTITEQQPPDTGVPAAEQLARVKQARRLMSFRFESNEPDGDYEMGRTVAHVDPADKRTSQ